MGYRFAVTDFVNEHRLTNLSATETRLSGALSQPRRIAFGCVAALTALGWLALGLMSAGSPLNWQALCQPGVTGGVERTGARRADVDGDDAGDDAADRGPDDPDLCRNRRHRGAQARAGGVAARF